MNIFIELSYLYQLDIYVVENLIQWVALLSHHKQVQMENTMKMIVWMSDNQAKKGLNHPPNLAFPLLSTYLSKHKLSG